MARPCIASRKGRGKPRPAIDRGDSAGRLRSTSELDHDHDLDHDLDLDLDLDPAVVGTRCRSSFFDLPLARPSGEEVEK